MSRRIDPLYLGIAGVVVLGVATMLASSSSITVPIVDVQAAAASARYTRGGPGVKGTLKRSRKRKGGAAGVRGIMLHQVDVKNVGASAWKKMSYHYGVTEDGKIYKIHPIDTLLFHGNGLNGTTVGISVGGSYGPDDKMPAVQVVALRQAIQLARQEILAAGGTVEGIFAHRQTSDERGDDPARDPWRQGALWARDTLGIPLHPTFRSGTGRTIPDSWMEPLP